MVMLCVNNMHTFTTLTIHWMKKRVCMRCGILEYRPAGWIDRLYATSYSMCVCVCSENICIFHSAAANTVQQSCRQRRLIFPLTLGIEKSYWDGSFNRCIYKLFRVHEKLLDKTTSSGFRQRLSNFPTANFRVCLRYKELHLNSCTW